MGSERRPQAFRVDLWHEEVGVLRVEPEQLVAHGATDEVGVESERTHVILDFLPHRAILAGPPGAVTKTSLLRNPDVQWLPPRRTRYGPRATASISTSAPDGSFATSTVARAGGCSPTCLA